MNIYSPSTLRMRADRLHFINFIVIFRINSSSVSVNFCPTSLLLIGQRVLALWSYIATPWFWRAFDTAWLYSLHKQLDVDEIILKWCGQKFLFKNQTPKKAFLKNTTVRVYEALNILTSNITTLVNHCVTHHSRQSSDLEIKFTTLHMWVCCRPKMF